MVAYNDKASVINLTETQGGTVRLYAKWTANTYTVTYEWALTDKGWMYVDITHQTRFKSWSVSNETLNIKTHGGSGWEVRYIGFPVEKGRTYTWSFDYTMPTLTANYGSIGAGKMRAQVLSSAPANNNCIDKQINTTAGSGYYEMTSASSGTAKLTFTAADDAEYRLCLNFGYCDDGTDLDFIFKNIKLTTTKTVTYDSTYGAMPSSWYYGYKVSKWTNASETTIATTTKVTTASNHTLYANMTANTYKLTFDVQKITPNSQTINGVTITKNSDGTVTFNGTLTASTGVLAYLPIQFKVGQKFQIYSTYISGSYSRAASSNCFVFELYKTNSGGKPSTRCNSDVGTPSQSNANTRFAHGAKEVTTDEQAACRYLGFWIWANSSSTTYTFTNYRVKFELGVFQQQDITFNSAYGDLPTPIKDGYTFDGWWTTASGGTEMTSTSIALRGNETLYAHWTGIQYTLTFDQNGGSGGALSAANYNTSPSAQTVTVTEPTRNGWTRTGWSITGYTGTAPSISGTTLTIPANTYGNITVTPVWTGNTYTITWSANGGTGGKVSKTSYTVSASSQTATITAPTRNGYSVSRYSVTGNTGSATISGTTLTIAANTYGNLTVTTNWSANTITITLNKNGGTGGTTTFYYKYGTNKFYSNSACTTTISKVTLPTKEYYNCSGYVGDGTSGGNNNELYVKSDGTFPSDLCTDIYKNATLTAQWSVKKYTLTVTWSSDSNGNGYWDFNVQWNGKVQVSSSQNGTQSGTKTFSIEATNSLSVNFYIKSPAGLIYHKTGSVSISGNCTNNGFGSRKAGVAEGTASLSGSASNFKENITISFYFGASK